jgi:hypothetical protein
MAHPNYNEKHTHELNRCPTETKLCGCSVLMIFDAHHSEGSEDTTELDMVVSSRPPQSAAAPRILWF